MLQVMLKLRFPVGLYFGVLIAISAVCMILMGLFIAVERMRENKAMYDQLREKEQKKSKEGSSHR